MFWPKTSLKNQQTHLMLLWILIYTFMIKNNINQEIIFIIEINS
jgi:hypothetical protein